MTRSTRALLASLAVLAAGGCWEPLRDDCTLTEDGRLSMACVAEMSITEPPLYGGTAGTILKGTDTLTFTTPPGWACKHLDWNHTATPIVVCTPEAELGPGCARLNLTDGTFDHIGDAIRARNAAAAKLHGAFAVFTEERASDEG